MGGFVNTFGKLVAVLAEQNKIRQREIDARLYGDKRRVYQQFFKFFMVVLQNAKSNATKGLTQKQMKEMLNLKTELVIWSNSDVIDAWNEFELTTETGPAGQPRLILLAMEKVMRVMRKDLGHDDSELTEGKLFSLFLTPESKKELMAGQDVV